MSDEARPEPDRLADAPHPRDTRALIGQGAAEAEFLASHASGRLHHAWLLTGPRGVGKATLAWRIARYLLCEEPARGSMFGDASAQETLDVPGDHPVVRRMLAGSEGRLFVLRRGWDDKTKRLRAEITVDETRKLRSFFGLSAADGGRRVVIVDAADEMNVNAANALLKVLEEPPVLTTLLLIGHQPARLLPTIRSRCRELRCRTLTPDEMARALTAAGHDPQTAAGALSELSGGSVGDAVLLASGNGPGLFADLIGLISRAPDMDRTAAVKLTESAAGRGREARRDLIVWLIGLLLARLARTGAGRPPNTEAAPGEADTLARLSPDPAAGRRWAALQQELSDRAGHGLAVNLDPSTLILDMILKINETAAAILSRP